MEAGYLERTLPPEEEVQGRTSVASQPPIVGGPPEFERSLLALLMPRPYGTESASRICTLDDADNFIPWRGVVNRPLGPQTRTTFGLGRRRLTCDQQRARGFAGPRSTRARGERVSRVAEVGRPLRAPLPPPKLLPMEGMKLPCPHPSPPPREKEPGCAVMQGHRPFRRARADTPRKLPVLDLAKVQLQFMPHRTVKPQRWNRCRQTRS
jgi:hypothetical protein